MFNDAKKLKTQEGFYAYAGIHLLLSSPIVKNFLQNIPHKNGLLGLLGNIAHGQPIQVSRLTICHLLKHTFTGYKL